MSSQAPQRVDAPCELCQQVGGIDVVVAPMWRVIRVLDSAFPAFYRVIWQEHVAEFSDLAPQDRATCMDVVATVEQVLRHTLQPTKINLASLGNMVPHLHWHVIARFEWDSHFPQPVWGTAQRAVPSDLERRLLAPLVNVDAAVAAALG